MFKIELQAIVNHNHAMVKLAQRMDWARLEETLGALYCDDNDAPGLGTWPMVALHYLKFTFDLSDEDVVAGWVEKPYWQVLSGMKHFEHRRPINLSSMTHWRKRVGAASAEAMLKETIAAGLAIKAIKPSQLARVKVDTTVQEKHVRFPTDARLVRSCARAAGQGGRAARYQVTPKLPSGRHTPAATGQSPHARAAARADRALSQETEDDPGARHPRLRAQAPTA